MNATREEALFSLALSKPADERALFLDRECGDDQPLRSRIEALLAAHDQPETLMATQAEVVRLREDASARPAQPTVPIDLADAPDEAVGQTLGRYKLLERLGEGGCGVVYVAEQTEPIRRRVALKVIKLGMDTKAVIARFEAERQALAMMDHPNIAKVLDAGTTDAGRPYFVMELVRGVAITHYCDQANLSTKERLGLFIKVCQAIQHAHQKGIIHRDIKPSNILVTLHDGEPVPKVIDFGIAKATEGRLTDATVYTQLHQLIGTPAYMSPEQAEMSSLDIDTRTDIYSLGVLLYELLAGRTPFEAKELMAAGLDAMRRTIREQEPARPSTKLAILQDEELSTTAKRRSTEPPKLLRQLQGDLDWIVMRCLEKDRTRRYETANGLAADLKRHLTNEPVVARPPSAGYRFQKALRRNKLAFAAVGTVAGTVVIGLVIAITLWSRADVAYRRALAAQAAEEAQRLKAQAAEKTAKASELTARLRAYASDINLAQQALAIYKLGRAQELLNRQRPQPAERDLRGWEWRYLWQQSRSDALAELCRKPDSIHSLAFSGDGKWLAVGEVDTGALSIMDLVSRREIARLPTGDDKVWAAFSPPTSLLAFSTAIRTESTNRQHAVCLWDGDAKQIVIRLPLGGQCGGLAFSGDGQTLVALTEEPDRQLVAWKMPDGRKLASYPAPGDGSDNNMTALAITRDGRLAAHIADGSDRIRVVDLGNGKELWNKQAADEEVTCIAFSGDGKILASGSGIVDGTIRLWEASSGREMGRLEGHRAWVGGLVFWPDGKTLASASADHTIRLWDIRDLTHVPPSRVLRGHKNEVWRLALSSDNTTLVSGCKDGSVYLWDTKALPRETALITLPQIATWRFTDGGRRLLTLDQQGRVEQRGGGGFQARETLVETGDTGARFWNSRLSKDGRLVAISSTDGVVTVWDLQRRVLLREIRALGGEVLPRALPAGGKRLITTNSRDGSYHEWDLTSGAESGAWRGAADRSGIVVFSENDQLCIDVASEGASVLRDITTGRETNLNLGLRAASLGEFSRDGRFFVLPSMAIGMAKVWETARFEPVATFSGFLLGVHSAAFSPDAKRVATASGGIEAVKLWDLESHHELITLKGNGSRFKRTAFSNDGNVLASMSDDGLLHLWRAPSWEEIAAAEAKERAEIKQP